MHVCVNSIILAQPPQKTIVLILANIISQQTSHIKSPSTRLKSTNLQPQSLQKESGYSMHVLGIFLGSSPILTTIQSHQNFPRHRDVPLPRLRAPLEILDTVGIRAVCSNLRAQ